MFMGDKNPLDLIDVASYLLQAQTYLFATDPGVYQETVVPGFYVKSVSIGTAGKTAYF
jgi:hypothetical protein